MADRRDGYSEWSNDNDYEKLYGVRMIKAVIDRFEGDFAILSIGDDERRFNVPRKSLPKGSKEGSWLQVELDGDTLLHVQLDPEETARARERIAEKMASLLRGDHLK